MAKQATKFERQFTYEFSNTARQANAIIGASRKEKV